MILISLFAVVSTLGFADGGNGSGAGGGPVVFQADLLKHVLSDNDFIRGFDTVEKAFIKSMEILHAAKGKSIYRVTSNGGCDIKVVTECTMATKASDCKVTYGSWTCP